MHNNLLSDVKICGEQDLWMTSRYGFSYRREAAFQNLAPYHRSSPGCHRVRFARLFEATQFFGAAYKFYENFCESAGRLEKPKSGEISDVLVLKVGDRGATAGLHTPYFHDSLYRLGWIVIRKSLQIELWSCIIVLPYGGACLEPPHASRPPAIS